MSEQDLLENLQDARAYHEKEYAWETQRVGNGGSKIAAGQHRRYADAIAIAAIRIGQSSEPRPSGPRWYHWALLVACLLATALIVQIESITT